jgi:hypothetical protein
MICYCYRFTCLIFRLIGLLAMAPVAFFLGGAFGTYEVLFGDISIAHNATQAASRAAQLIYDSYQTGHTPAPFVTWGLVALAVYVFLCVFYILVKFSCICHECSRAIDESDEATKRAIEEMRSSKGRTVIDVDSLSSLDQHAALRSEYARASQTNNSVL